MTRGVLATTLLVSVALGGWIGCAGPDSQTGQHVAGATAVAGSFAFGDVTVDHNWKRVNWSGTVFIDSVVIAKPFSSNGGDPGVVRIRNVDSWGFEIRIQEWSYLDGPHTKETVSFIAVEGGRHQLPSTMGKKGGMVEAAYIRNVTEGAAFARVTFAKPFSVTPVVLASVATASGSNPVVGRIRRVSKAGFEFRLQKEEGNKQPGAAQDVHYVAWEPSRGALGGGFEYIAAYSSPIDHQFTSIPFSGLGESPVFVADMQTTDGGNTANLRWRNKSVNGVQVRVAEEQAADAETWHVKEQVGFVVLGQTGTECRTNAGCDDRNPCTVDSCKPTGQCAHDPISGCCAKDEECHDGDPCTQALCVANRCTHPPIAGCCVDGDQCAAGEVCSAGLCVVAGGGGCGGGGQCLGGSCGTPPGSCGDDADCAAGEVCSGGLCVVAGGGGQCQGGSCGTPPRSCGDSDQCAAGEVCSGGLCVVVGGGGCGGGGAF